jgi:pimeloyl-ACP methyl ester carboxylesterase
LRGRRALKLDHLVGIDAAASQQLRSRRLSRYLQLGGCERVGLGHGVGRSAHRAQVGVEEVSDAPALCRIAAFLLPLGVTIKHVIASLEGLSAPAKRISYPDFLNDGAKAFATLRRIVAGHSGDPERIFLAGHSAGAYIAVMLALDARYVIRVGEDIGSIRGVIGIAGSYDFLPIVDPRQIEIFRWARTARNAAHPLC